MYVYEHIDVEVYVYVNAYEPTSMCTCMGMYMYILVLVPVLILLAFFMIVLLFAFVSRHLYLRAFIHVFIHFGCIFTIYSHARVVFGGMDTHILYLHLCHVHSFVCIYATCIY